MPTPFNSNHVRFHTNAQGKLVSNEVICYTTHINKINKTIQYTLHQKMAGHLFKKKRCKKTGMFVNIVEC